MTTHISILSEASGLIGKPEIIVKQLCHGSGNFSAAIGQVTGYAPQFFAVGIFHEVLLVTGMASQPSVSIGGFASPIRQPLMGRGKNLGDSWSDWFRNYTG